MKTPFVTSCAAFGTLLAPVVVVAHDADCSQPATFVKDSLVTRTIKTKLAAEYPVRLERVHIETNVHGIEWLSGNSGSQKALDKAVAIARATECVRAVTASWRSGRPGSSGPVACTCAAERGWRGTALIAHTWVK